MREMIRFVILTATFVVAMVMWADAQSQTGKIPRVGILQSTSADDAKRNIDAFGDGMRELGWVEGKNVVFEYRYAGGDLNRLAGFAAELVKLNVDIILAAGSQSTAAAKKATATIPIVAGAAGDLVGTGLVESLARPGGNITGSTVISPDLSGKRLELLKEVIPNAVRIAVLLYPGSRTDRDELKQIEAVAQIQKLRVQIAEVRHPNDFQPAFASMKRENAQALILIQSSLTNSYRRQLLDLATKNRLPAMCESARWSIDGCLISYGPDSVHQYRRAAHFVDKILKGTKPADIPVEQPMKFELLFNLKIAKTDWTHNPSVGVIPGGSSHQITVRRAMKQKLFLTTVITLILTHYVTAQGQQPTRVPRIGFLSSTDNRLPFDRFYEGLRDLGYVEGKNIVIDFRTAQAKRERMPSLIRELIDLKVDIIVSTAQPAIEDAKQITKTVPIVMIAGFDPVEAGVIDSLARPGGNITGVSTLQRELSGKRLEILTEVIPKASRVALLWEPKSRGPVISFKEYESAARALKLSIQSLEAHQPNPDFGVLFSNAAKGRVDGVVVIANSLMRQHQKTIANLAIKHRLPSINETSDYVDNGGLLSYAADDAFGHRRAAYYVDRILKGTNPADLPVEQPTKFDFVVNLKTAKQIRLTIPPNVLARADRVIR